jgi:hypothetical protein
MNRKEFDGKPIGGEMDEWGKKRSIILLNSTSADTRAMHGDIEKITYFVIMFKSFIKGNESMIFYFVT